MKINYIKVLKVSILIFICSLCFPVFASSGYGDINNRIIQNQNMYDITNSMSATARNSYTDKYLKDMFETDYEGMTTTQQQKIYKKALDILGDNHESLTDYQKLAKFNDWIRQRFYYDRSLNKDSPLGDNRDNPYYILSYYYNNVGTDAYKNTRNYTIARCNGFTSMFIALARSQGIPARSVTGFYNPPARTNTSLVWGEDVDKNDSKYYSHVWAQAYLKDENRWITLDPNADCRKTFDPTTKPSDVCKEAGTDMMYFDVSAENLSRSHIMFKFRGGSASVKYLTNSYEKGKITTFLNKTYSNKKNGKRINYSYSTSNPSTWFSKDDTKSAGDGYGKLRKIYWPSKKGLYGSLDLSGFSALQNFYVTYNNITRLYLYNCPNLSTVSASQNKLKTVIVTNSTKLSLLSIQGNPTMFVRYNFGTSKRTAIIKTYAGGTVSVRYSKTSTGKHKHEMSAFANRGYKFKGWYSNGKKISSRSSIAPYKTYSFTYIAKFVRR